MKQYKEIMKSFNELRKLNVGILSASEVTNLLLADEIRKLKKSINKK